MRRRQQDHELLRRVEEAEAARAQAEGQVAELQARIAELQRANQDLNDFAYLVSHDLKEPLRGIRTYCEVLLADYRKQLDDEGNRQLHAMMTLSDRLDSLIDGVMDYCRAGRTEPAPVGADLNAVAHEAIELLRPVINRRCASVVVVDRLPAVAGDPLLLGMVLANLISNGLRFNESPSPRVEIGYLAGPEPAIYVRDNGIGIAPEYHEDVFTVFRRLHGRKKYEGSGVGLAIVRRIVASHGGRVWLESQPGHGTTFFLTLPLCVQAPGKMATSPPHWGCFPATPADISPSNRGSQRTRTMEKD